MARLSRFVFAALALLIASCSSSTSYDVTVRLVSDFVPGPEVRAISTTLYDGHAAEPRRRLERTERPVRFGDGLSRGLVVGTFRNVAPGPYSVHVRLTDASGAELASRVVTLVVTDSRTYTVHITRECAARICPESGDSSASACLGGRCVDPRCTADDRTHCPSDLFCNLDAECTVESSCGEARCDEGVCVFEARDRACGDTEWCAHEAGCAPLDMPELPSGPDPRCGTICALEGRPCEYGYYACSTDTGEEPYIVCTPFLRRPVGAPCGELGVCDEAAECVPAADAGIPLDASPDAMTVSDTGMPDMDLVSDTGVSDIDAMTVSDTGMPDMDLVSDTGVSDMDLVSDTSVPDMGPTTCDDGYELVSGACEDVNECARGETSCEPGACWNLPGTYECGCPGGYAGTGTTTCTDVNECDTDNGGCDVLTECTNTPGGRTCGDCPDGYVGGGLVGCMDVNECDEGSDACGDGVCSNTPGDYECLACALGYRLSEDGRACVDIDECTEGTDSCGAGDCANTMGGFECTCPSGTVALDGSCATIGWTQFSAGNNTFCGIKSGELWCWGAIERVGIASGAASETPVSVLPGAAWTGVSVGQHHACGVRFDGRAYCWGANNQQWGLGAGPSPSTHLVPTEVAGDRRWTQVSAGSSGGCGIEAGTAAAFCWGTNAKGQLGDGTTSSSYVPVAVNSTARWHKVVRSLSNTGSGGLAMFACGLQENGSLWCWGGNNRGQLGNGTTTDSLVPIEVTPGTLYSDLELDAATACAIRSDDRALFCWGYNDKGQLGLGDTTNRTVPTLVTAGAEWSSVTVGGYDHSSLGTTTCGIRTDGSLWCWGRNNYGQVGKASSGDSNVPVAIAPGRRFRSVSMSFGVCAIEDNDDRTLWCWGYTLDGTPSKYTPVPVGYTDTAAWKTVSAYDLFSCAIKSDDSLWCWGRNNQGQLGIGSTADQLLPQQVSVGQAWKEVSTGGYHLDRHVCAIRSDDSLWCWGRNNYRQLGDNTTTDRSSPIEVTPGTPYTHVSTSGNSTCAIRKSDDSLWCWGYNGHGNLGNGTTTNSGVPVQVAPGSTWKSIVAGTEHHTCGIQTDDTLWCWGRNVQGQLGDGTTVSKNTPVQIGVGETFASVATSWGHSCAIRTDESLWCWGNNVNATLGDGTTTSSTTPVAIGVGSTWAHVSAGSQTTCALRKDGAAFCWGNNGNGTGSISYLGDGTTTNRAEPTAVVGAHLWRELSAARTGGNTCAVRADGTLWCWGANHSGQHGNASLSSPALDRPLTQAAFILDP